MLECFIFKQGYAIISVEYEGGNMLLSVSSVAGIVLDVVIIALVAIFGLIGFKKGFFKSVISMISTLVVILISIFCASPLARIVNKLYDFTGLIARGLCKTIASMGAFYSQPIPEGMSGADVVSNIPQSTNGFLKKLMSYALNPLSAGDIQSATVADIVSGAFASIIMLIICGIVLFIFIKIILAIATRLFENITRNRVFGATNKLLGLVFGAVKGFIIVLVFSIILTLLTVIPAVNTKVSPVIQDHSKIARPIYNYTDEFMEKHVVEGKIVQKWIDKLWQNKYKGRGEDTPVDNSPNGTFEKPYEINIIENSGVYTATISIDFASASEMYYLLNSNTVSSETFTLSIATSGEELTYVITSATDANTIITDLSTLAKNKNYIIKFTKGTNNQISASLMLTPNA